MPQDLADEALTWARDWVHNNTHLVPEWQLAQILNHSYPGGFIKFLSDYRFINRGEIA